MNRSDLIRIAEDLKIIDERINTNLIQKQRAAFETEFDNIINVKQKKGESAAVFRLKEEVVGSKSATVIINHKSG